MTTFTYSIENMHCENCAEKIINVLENQSGVEDLHINLEAKSITVTGEIAPDTIVTSLEEIGFKPMQVQI
tara:strand:+ start:180 stop:389 length:210 start_codon:yes stop_codon:yes gene_type:complete